MIGGREASDKYHKRRFSVFCFLFFVCGFWEEGQVDDRDFGLAKFVNSWSQAFQAVQP
jgi:hypothetical protein